MQEAVSSLERLRSDAMGGKWSEILETYKNDRALRTEKITATGDTLLHMAVSNWQVEVVEKMVDWLVQEENNVVVMEEGGEVSQNVNIVLGAENDEKNTPLHLAAIRGNVNMCKKIGNTVPSLIARRNNMGETPLFLAALAGNKEAFLWLHYLYERSLGAPADFAHCVRDNHDTILHCAIAQERNSKCSLIKGYIGKYKPRQDHIGVAIEIVYLYKDHMKEMMKRNKEGLTPLHLLASMPSAFPSTTLPELPTLLHRIYALCSVKEKDQATKFEELQPSHSQEEDEETSFQKLGTWICAALGTPLWLILLSIILSAALLGFLLGVLLGVLLYVLLPPILLLFSEEAFQKWLHNIPEMKQKHIWCHQIMTELLKQASDEDMSQIISRNASKQPSISLQIENDTESESGTIAIETPLIFAVKNGVVEMVEKILELFPSRIEDVNADGKNILLLAVEYRQIKVLRFLCKQEWLTGSLFRQEDKDGNNALHLAAVSSGKDINWFKVVKDSMPLDLLGRYNRKMKTPEDIFSKHQHEYKKSEGEWVAKTSEACSLVSTLVVSVAFSTRTNVPGGYDGDSGYAILRNKPGAFKTFRDSSFAALFLSLISTIFFLSIVASRSQSAHSVRHAPSTFYCGIFFMFGSIVCLSISFCAADFFMLHDDPQKLHKALPTYILLTCGVILIVVLLLPKFLRPKISYFQSFLKFYELLLDTILLNTERP